MISDWGSEIGDVGIAGSKIQDRRIEDPGS
jgi:hypothetical protein